MINFDFNICIKKKKNENYIYVIYFVFKIVMIRLIRLRKKGNVVLPFPLLTLNTKRINGTEIMKINDLKTKNEN